MTGPTISRIDSLKSLVEQDPGNPLVHYMLANEYVKAKMYEEALRTLGVYFGLKDDEGSAYRLEATANLELGREAEAKESYRKGIEAAARHHHASMVSEFESALEDLS